MSVDARRQAEFDAAVRDVAAAVAPLIASHNPVVLAVAMASMLGAMADALHKEGVLRPTLAGSMDVVNGWVAAGVHGSVAKRCATHPDGGRA